MSNSPTSSNASHPGEFATRDWKQIFNRTAEEISKDNIGIISAGMAFYMFLGIFPLLAALISIYSLIASPSDLDSSITSLKGLISPEIGELLRKQIGRLSSKDSGAGWAFTIGLLTALWSGSKAMKGCMVALNIAYDESEERSFLKKNFIALIFSFLGIVWGASVIFILTAFPALLEQLIDSSTLVQFLDILRWPILFLAIVLAMSILYQWAPDKKNVGWRWITPGSGIAALLFLLSSFAFSYYVSNFGNFNQTYGSLGAIAGILLWFYLSAYTFLLGAELDAEIEQQAGISFQDDKQKKRS